MVEKMCMYGFNIFAKNREEARVERAKWRMANNRAYKTAATKVMRSWEEFWLEEKKYRHLVRFSLRSIRRNRLAAMFGIWQYDWMIGKRDKAIISARTLREQRQMKINSMIGFMNQHARKKRHRAMIARMTDSRNDLLKAKIVTAWKFVIDYEVSLQHKLHFFWQKAKRARKIDAVNLWWAFVLNSRREKGLVVRTQRYHRFRRLTQAMEDWACAARMQHKLRLLEICERDASDPLDLAQAMEHVVEGVVLRQHVRTHELQVAHALRGRIADLRLHASVVALEQALGKKVDKPTAEMIQRRGLRNWESISSAQSTGKTSSDKLAVAPAPLSPAAYTKKIREELMTAAGNPPAPAPAVTAPAETVAPAAEAGAAQAAPVAQLPVSSHRALLDQQFRTEAARQMTAAGAQDRYMRLAAFDAAHGVTPVDPATFMEAHMMHVAPVPPPEVAAVAAARAQRDAAVHADMVAAGLVPPVPNPIDEANALHRARAQVQSLQNAMANEVAGATQGEAPAADAAPPTDAN
jgi:hypothetical protein